MIEKKKNNYPYFMLNKSIDKSSEYSDRKSDFNLEKYEKFRPKNKEEIDKLRGAENDVKHMLSLFLNNIETEKRSSVNYRNIKTIKTKKTNNSDIKIVKTISETDQNIITNNSFNKNLLSPKSKSRKILNPLENSLHHFKNIQSNSSQTNSMSFSNKIVYNKDGNKIFRKKKNSVVDRKFIKHKFNGLFDIVRTLSTDILKRNKTYTENNGKSKKVLKRSSKSIDLNLIDSQIKKRNSLLHSDNYINFKTDIIKRGNRHKAFNLKSLIRRKENSIKKGKKRKILFNDSSQNNSIISDQSDINLKKSLNQRKSMKNVHFKIKRKLFAPSSPRNNINTKSLIDEKKKSDNILMRAKTNIMNNDDIVKPKRKSIFSSLKLDKNFIYLKDKLQKSIILRPEDADKSINEDEKSINSINESSTLSNKKYINKRTSKKVSIFNNNKLMKDNNNHLIHRKKMCKSHKTLPHYGLKKNNFNLKRTNPTNDDNSNIELSKKERRKKYSKKGFSAQSQKHYSKNNTSASKSLYMIKKNTLYHEKFRVLTHKKIVYDSLDDEEVEDEEEINKLLIDPNSTFNILFDAILLIFTCISFIEIPLYLATSESFCRHKKITFVFSINAITEILYILDFLFAFFRAYYNFEEQLIKKYRKIFKKYIGGWFFFDLLASIPFYIINKWYEPICIKSKTPKNYSAILKDLHYLLLCSKASKVVKVFTQNQAWKLFSNRLNEYGNIILSICLVIATINYTSCLYIFVGRNSYPNWIMVAKLDSEPFIHIYICSIYLLIMALTTVGYGDITCYSLNERVFLLLILFVGIIGYSWVVSFVSNYIKKINEKSVEFIKKKTFLDEIKANYPNLPEVLYDKIVRFLKFKNFHEKQYKNIIFDCLPVGLKNDLISEMYKPIIENFIFFKSFRNTDFIVRVILAFKPVIAYKNDILVNDGDMVEDIMFVKKGLYL